MNMTMPILMLGIGATLTVDLWALVRAKLLGVPQPDYRLLGRWVGHCARATFWHPAIAKAPGIRHERLLGWCVHYLVGIGFAGLFALIMGDSWLADPTFAPALLFGVATVLAPFLIMQPAMGSGWAGHRTPSPWRTRLHSVLTHAAFGTGLYVCGRILMI